MHEVFREVKQIVRKQGETRRILLHTDAAQALGKITVDVEALGVDYLTVVGHKVYWSITATVFFFLISSFVNFNHI